MEEGRVQPRDRVNAEDRKHPTRILRVENQPKQILPETFAKNLLLGTRGKQPLDREHHHGDKQQPEIEAQINGHGVAGRPAGYDRRRNARKNTCGGRSISEF